ncbi:hypothetical protein J2Z37_004435 [Ammoniphilus resinae]|uniref:Transposase n=1 Tax=Ammoniphilus resinae TaxID=861532 RepID=A0ABS4GVV7_9BACL|nr:hypothetical protein [Ammoniphilus resinae]
MERMNFVGVMKIKALLGIGENELHRGDEDQSAAWNWRE